MARADVIKGLGRAPKARAVPGIKWEFISRDGERWDVRQDSDGYMYAQINGSQVASTAYGYGFTIEAALTKALSQLESE